MTGFGSFREPARVDFADIDFFALVGPTGAGKSTVIDAMTFALYGTVPRWDDRRTVGLALAPTVKTGIVSLVFDVRARRYIVVRELRRTRAGVNIHNGRLERLIDPAAFGSPDDETELIAADGKVNGAVEQLLGLSFDHFCSCVVLPQGDFADFLHAKPSERQKILTRLLGVGLYETIGQRANTEAAAAKQRLSLLDEQIGRLDTVTPEAAGEANERVQQLTALKEQVAVILPSLAAAATAVDEARRNTDRIRGEQELLDGLTVPPDLATRAERLAEAASTADQAAAALAAAETADEAARAAFETASAKRGGLEQTRRDHAEHSQLEQRLPTAERDRAEAATTLAAVTVGRDAADQAAAVARETSDAARRAAAAVWERVQSLRAEHGALSGVSVPPGVDDIHAQEAAAKETHAAARRRLSEAEEAESDARRDLEAAPTRSALEQAKRDHAALSKLGVEDPDLASQAEHAQEAVTAAQAKLDATIQALKVARLARNEAGRAEAASVLRPHLVAGEPCPVCEHPVQHLPAPLEQQTLAAAEQALTAAERNRDAAAQQHTNALGQEQKATGALAAAREQAVGLRQALAGRWADEQTVDDELSRLDTLNARLEATGSALRSARADHDAARQAAATLADRYAAARTELSAARDPLVSLGAPSLDGLGLAEAWHLLTTWSGQMAEARAKLLDQAEDEANRAETESSAKAERLKHAQAEAARLDQVKVAAERTDQETDLVLRQINSRLAELALILAKAPTDAEAAAELAQIDQLGATAKTAQKNLTKTRAARDAAAKELAALTDQQQADWNEFRTARDVLVPLGAPPIREDNLRAAWAELVAWTDRELRRRQATFADAQAALSVAASHQRETELALKQALSQAGLVVAPPLAAEAVSAAVAGELAHAHAHVRSIEAQLSQLADLRSSRATTDEEYAVANTLGGLLRSNEFPRWLMASALDVLVQDASANFSELSGGQFELAHEDGDFLVIDHNNADLSRPVKTLSGGETFQASLALALALSAQITTMAADGAARLDSIFLDEGFGTLDDETLETVANTLENLASRADRMVGAVTHVGALADRVPVRFRVARDQFGSTVTREPG